MPESSISRLIDETVVVQVLGSPPQLVSVTETVAPVLPGEPMDEVLVNPDGIPVVAAVAVPPTQVISHPAVEVVVTAVSPGLPGLRGDEATLVVQLATDTAQAVADAAIQSVLDASAYPIRYDAPQGRRADGRSPVGGHLDSA